MTIIGPWSMPPMNAFSVARARVVVVCLLVAFAGLAGRVVYLQACGRQPTIRRAGHQQHLKIIRQDRRGSIYDRNGMVMAGTVQTPSRFVDPTFMQDQFQEDGKSLVEMDRMIAKLAVLI